MIDLFDTDIKPNSGWQYKIPENNMHLRKGTYKSLVQAVKNQYRLSGLVLPSDIEYKIQKYICSISSVKCNEDIKKAVPSLKAVVAGTSAIIDMLRKGLVEQSVADGRAEICASCSKNVSVYACIWCSAVMSSFKHLFGNKKSKADIALKACGVCKCFNAAQVWAKTDALKLSSEIQNITADKYPEHCWKRKELEKTDV